MYSFIIGIKMEFFDNSDIYISPTEEETTN